MQEQHVQNLAKMGENPGLPTYQLGNSGPSLARVLISANTSKPNVVLYKMHKPRPKGLSHDKLGPPAMSKLRTKSKTDLRRKIQALIDTSVERRAERGQPQASRPRPGRPTPNCLISDRRQSNRLHQAIRSIHTKAAQNSTEILGRRPA